MAFQFMLGLLSVFLGTNKIATKIIGLIPSAIKSGIIIGAGIAAITTVFKAEEDLIYFHTPSPYLLVLLFI